jgi:hypothetical protein
LCSPAKGCLWRLSPDSGGRLLKKHDLHRLRPPGAENRRHDFAFAAQFWKHNHRQHLKLLEITRDASTVAKL